MSLTQTYYIASSARSKLGREAGRADHNLRRLVGHANLLDNLMVELADAEREQEAWFNQSVRTAAKPQDRHIQWIDTIEEAEDSDEDMDSDIEDDFEIPVRSIRTPTIVIESEVSDELDEEDDEEHALVRVPSRHTPPGLSSDDSDSEDESMPASPESLSLEYNSKEQPTTAAFFNPKQQSGLEDYIMQQSSPMIAAY